MVSTRGRVAIQAKPRVPRANGKKRTQLGGVRSVRGRSRGRVSANGQNRTNLHRGRSDRDLSPWCARCVVTTRHTHRHTRTHRSRQSSDERRGREHAFEPANPDERANFCRPSRGTRQKHRTWFTRATSTRPGGRTRGPTSRPTASRSVSTGLPKERDEVCLNNVLLDATNVE